MKKVIPLFFFLLLLGCVTENKPPENIMTRQEMIDFLIDLHIVEAKISMSRIPYDSIKLFFPEVEDSLYRKHQISDTLYKKSYQYYLKNITLMEEIYSAVVDSLSLRERILSTQ
jgi:hypothetical protein